MSGKSPGLPVSLWQFSPPLFSVFIDARNALQDDVLTTLLALNAQSYRNIEVFLSVPPGWETNPHWTECCRTLRGLSYLTNDDADDCRTWRGDYAVAIKPGSRIHPLCFPRIVTSLAKIIDEASFEIIRLEDEPNILFVGRSALNGKPVPGSLLCDSPLAFFLKNASIDLTVASDQEVAEWMEPVEACEVVPKRLPPIRRAVRRWASSVRKRYRKYSGLDEAGRRWMARSDMFDKDWYLLNYPDVFAAQVDPLDHYLRHGWREGRLPTQWFTQEFAGLFGFDSVRKESPLASMARMPDCRRSALVKGMTAFRARKNGTEKLRPGLFVQGNFRAASGLGQAARNLSYAADAARIPLVLYDVSPLANSSDDEFRTKCGLVKDRRAAVHVFGAVRFVRHAGDVCSKRTDIMYPFWELGKMPEDRKEFVDGYEEIWAPSSFVADACSAGWRLPVSVLPQPVRIPVVDTWMRNGGRPFQFLTYMDFDSYPARKNPEGPVRAFSRAFADGRNDVRLCVKVRGNVDRGRRQWLADAASREFADIVRRAEMHASR